ncbi:ZIP family metal transporter [Candidatus Saccharibacteria bacterium]|nr:ZIP family metal transporter [Candidatus Saccharibacteria bacterium]
MLEVLLIICVTVATALISLAGGFLLLSGSKLAQAFQKYGSYFAALVLLYAVFGDIIPEVLEELPAYQVALLTAAGTGICTLISFGVGHFHKHGDEKTFKDKKQAYAMLIVDSLHTAMDGIVIGTSFASGIPTGLTSAFATAAHEIPQEIGDFSIMIRSKMKKRKIAKLQIISALVLVPFALIAYFVGDAIKEGLPALLALIAGFFLYIALAEIYSIIKAIWEKAKKVSPKVKEIK